MSNTPNSERIVGSPVAIVLGLGGMQHRNPLRYMYRFCLLFFISFLLPACGSRSTLRPTHSACIPDTLNVSSLSRVTEGDWQTYNSKNGLPYDGATSIAMDPAGGIWIGTARGAAYYDGSTWTTYTEEDGLLSNLVLAIAVESNSTTWFGTDKGVTRFDGDTWTHFTETDGLPAGYIQNVTLDRAGNVWFGIAGAGSDWAFGNGVASLDDHDSPGKGDDRWQVYLPTRERMAGGIVSSIVDTGPSGIWFGVTPEGTVRVNNGRGGIWRLTGLATPELSDDQWEVKRVTDGVMSDGISSFALTSDGDLWLGTLQGLMYLTSEAIHEFSFGNQTCYTQKSGLPSDRVLSLAVDGQNRAWIGTDAGLAVIQNDEIHVVTKSDGLADNHIRAITIAADGTIWVATPVGISVRR
jgi:ligand-binding sensor domain-containing protein